MRRLLTSIWRDRSGITAVEFALILPILAVICAGTVEFGRMILLSQKLQNGTFILADLVARDETLSVGQIDNLFLAVDNILQPFDFGAEGLAVVTSVLVDDDGDPMISWQRNGSGALSATSEIGLTGDIATLPDDLTLQAGETLIVSELFYDFQPVIGMTARPQVMRRVAYVKPRLGTLESLEP